MPDTPLNPDALENAYAKYAELTVEEWRTRPHSAWRERVMEDVNLAVSAYLAVAQPEVNSVEEAERLPHMSVILVSEGCAWQRNGHQNGWATWSALGDEFFTSAIDAFPARVLYRPEVNDA